MDIPEDHPRRASLLMREAIADGVERGLVDQTGLIAHGRGEAFDYLIGERTLEVTAPALEAAAAALLVAERPVISVNGNTAVLAGREIAALSRTHGIPVEVNIFHRTDERLRRLVTHISGLGVDEVLGLDADSTIPGLAQPRALCSSRGIFGADTVLVPLEDGDRAAALVAMGKTVIAIDLNPLSRTARTATITVVDNVVRAIPAIDERMDGLTPSMARTILRSFDNARALAGVVRHIRDRLTELSGDLG